MDEAGPQGEKRRPQLLRLIVTQLIAGPLTYLYKEKHMQTLWEHRYARRTQVMQSSAIREILKLTQSPDIISFAGGLPAPEAFPVEPIREACDFVLTEIGPQALQYYPTEGYVPLREMLCGFAAEQGLKVAPENVLITSGSQQALDILGKVFINRGDFNSGGVTFLFGSDSGIRCLRGRISGGSF